MLDVTLQYVCTYIADSLSYLAQPVCSPGSTTAEALQTQFSGYGANLSMVSKSLDRIESKDSMESWDDDMIKKVVDAFLDERFPTVVVSL